MKSTEKAIQAILQHVEARNPHQPEFLQAVDEVVRSVMPVYLERSDWRDAKVLERITEPDRIISFRVTWEDDEGNIHLNRAWRVQFSNVLGPYKGGLRLHPTVNESVLKFLGFEQIFKNSLTELPIGGAKGGADFDPRGKSDREVMRFCQAMMDELCRHIGEDVDVPAGDIGVGSREIGYLFGHYTRVRNRWAGVLTGKDCAFGGSPIRAEATGYGCIYFCQHMLEHKGASLASQRVAISGSGNVALYAARKAIDEGARVVTLSDSDGTLVFEDGLSTDQLNEIVDLKLHARGRLSELSRKGRKIQYIKGKKPWDIPCELALPCATQNEIDEEDARQLVSNGTAIVCEGANMPVTAAAAEILKAGSVAHAPGKASNAGGVAVSAMEQSQNAMRVRWSADEVNDRLRDVMQRIHQACLNHSPATESGDPDYVSGANIAGFERVATAVAASGLR